jgi:hypothetical protein
MSYLDQPGTWSFSVAGAGAYSPGALNAHGLSPIQLLICRQENADVKVGGGYCWYSDSAGNQLQVTLMKASETVRVLVASTGKTLASKTFYGDTGCPSMVMPPADGSSTMTDTNPVGSDEGQWVDSYTNLP